MYKKKFGSEGSGEGELNCPTGVAVLPNDDVAVAEQKNKRVQVRHIRPSHYPDTEVS